MNASELRSRLLRTRDEIIENNPDAIRPIIEQLGIKPDNIVLDAATGTGQLLPYIIREISGSGWVDAYDSSCGLLEQTAAAHASSGKARFILGDVEHDAIFGAYDAVVIFCMLPTFDDPVSTVKHLYDDHLMPGGHLVIGFPCSKEVINSLHDDVGEKRHARYLDSAEELSSRLSEAGLNVAYTRDDDSAYIITLRK
ncbi:methyltransferase domain-containing protein [uncultured Muribaculum sp.]|uniref:methyltransferase domain-containing protein n=1 Tax=uncultured Muribaculum sp. TaxID=1918613 RepID=UPI0025D1ADB8|nr:methyltransferase domain-containing protein [uncultured Muribaculum sp.]